MTEDEKRERDAKLAAIQKAGADQLAANMEQLKQEEMRRFRLRQAEFVDHMRAAQRATVNQEIANRHAHMGRMSDAEWREFVRATYGFEP